MKQKTVYGGEGNVIKFLKDLRNGGVTSKTRMNTQSVIKEKPYHEQQKDKGAKPLPYIY